MKTREAPLYTTDETVCPKCSADRSALFALAKAQASYPSEYRRPALDAIKECPLCVAAWEKEEKHA